MKALIFFLTAVLVLAYLVSKPDIVRYQFDSNNCGAVDNRCDPGNQCLLARCVNFYTLVTYEIYN